MKYNTIKIGGIEVDLKDEKGLLRVLEIDGGIGEIKGTGSNSNLKFAGGKEVMNLFRNNPINEIIVNNGGGEVFRGLCILIRMDLSGNLYNFDSGDFEVAIISNNAVWFEALNAITLRDLDWGIFEYNHGTIVDGTLADVLVDKYGFGLGKWGKWENDNSVSVSLDPFMVNLEELTFVGFIRFILINGFKKIGYTLKGDFLNNAFMSGCMPFAMKVYDEEFLKSKYDLEVVVEEVKTSRIVSGGAFVIGNGDGQLRNSSTSVYSEILNNPKKSDGTLLFRDRGRPSWYQQTPQVPAIAPNRFSYECVETGEYEVFIENSNYTSSDDFAHIVLEVFVGCPTNGLPNAGTSKGTVNLNNSIFINLTSGDVVDFNFWVTGPFSSTVIYYDIKWGIKWSRNIGLNKKWDISGLMPKWKVSDVLLGCVHALNLKFETDEVLMEVTGEPCDEWKDGIGLNEGFFKGFSGESYNTNGYNKKTSHRLKNRVSLSDSANWDKIERYKEIKLRYGLDGTGGGLLDRFKANVGEGVFVSPKENLNKIIEDENPFFKSTYQIYDDRIKGTNSQYTPIVPILANFDYYDVNGGTEKEADYEDVPRLLGFGGQRVFISGYVKGGTIRMDGNNNYALPALWVVNYNDEEGTDISFSYGDEYNLKGVKIWGLIRRFYFRDFLRLEEGNKYNYYVDYGVGRVLFREVYDYDGKRLILKKVEGFDGRESKFCKTYFLEDKFILVEDLGKVKDSVIKSIGNTL